MIGIFINLWNRLIGAGGAAISYVLDEYSGAAAAYSLRKLSSTYGGSAVRVRRASDNTEQDIGFVGQDLDETALMNFVGYQNLVQRSEEFENAYWGKTNSTVTSNSTTAPNGTLTADTFIENTVNTFHQVELPTPLTTISGQTYTFSVYAKQAAGTRFIGLQPVGSGAAGNNQTAVFDLVNGVFLGNVSPPASSTGTFFTSANTSIQSVGNGWYRISCTTTVTGTVYYCALLLLNAFSTAGLSYAGDGTSGVFLWGAQLNAGTTAQPYQVTTSAARSGDGFVTKWYTQDGNGENLLLQSETFENAYWNKASAGTAVSSNSILAPNGTLTAETLSETAVNGDHYVGLVSGLTLTNVPYTLSCYYKANQRTWAALSMYNGTNSLFAYFDLQNGVLGNVDAGATASIQSVGNGWYRCSMTRTMSTSINNFIGIGIATSNGVNLYLGVVGSGVYIWGAQLSQSSWLQGYQATTTSQVFRRDASQSTAANQPRIVGGGVIERENGKASIFFDGVDDVLAMDAVAPLFNGEDIPLSVFSLVNVITAGSLFSIARSNNNNPLHIPRPAGTSVVPNQRRDDLATLVSVIDPFSKKGAFTYAHMFSGTVLSISNNDTDTVTASPMNVGALTGLDRASIGGLRYNASPNGSSFTASDISELILYPTYRYTDRNPIQRNIGAYYQTQWTGASSGLLDQFGGAAAAYSLRNLSSSYRGPLIRVRRSSDNAETDIGGTYNGDLDVASLLSFTGGQNLALQSEDFSSGSWSKVNSAVTANATIAPDGTLTADKITETAVNGGHVINQNFTISALSTYTLSFYAKAAERSKIFLVTYFAGSPFDGQSTFFDLSNGTVYQSGPNGAGVHISSSIQSVGNGWYRCSVTGNTNKTGIHNIQLDILNDSWQRGYLGTAGSGVYLWGAQLNTGILQPYIPTTTAAVNGANAFVTKWYTQDDNYQNLLLQSNSFTVSPWTSVIGGTGVAPVLTANAGTDPFGGNTATRLVMNAGAGSTGSDFSSFLQTATGVGTSTCSIWVKSFSGTTQYLNLNIAGGVGIEVIATNVWQRVSFTSSSGNRIQLVSSGVNTSKTADILIYGAQLNEGTLTPYTATTTTVSQRRDAIQATAASQPRIVNAGGIESEGNRPALFFDGSNDFFSTPNINVDNLDWSTFHVSRNNSPITRGFEIGSNQGPYFGRANDGNTYIQYVGTTDYYYSASDTSTTFNLRSGFARAASANFYLNGSNITLAAPISFTAVDSNFNLIGKYSSSPTSDAEASELVLYIGDRLSSRTGIESNINSYYRIYWQGNGTALLDNFSGASAAYSLRNLSSAYTGPLIRVRRSSDNVERDIYGTFGGDLDIASLVAFVGANSGFVTTWYDQSGNARHATQATAGAQPRIVNAGVVETEGGKPSINFFGTSAFMNANGAFTGTSFTSFSVYKQPSTVSRNAYNLYTTGGTYVQIVEYSTNNSSYIRPSTGVATQYGSGVFVDRQLRSFTYIDSFIFTDYRNTGIFYSNNFGVTMTPSTSLQINRFVGIYGENLVFQELIFFPTDRSSIRTAAETNINNYYKIY